MKKISFVIPVYQNEGSIKETHKAINELFNNELSGYKYEVIFVDDGSTDGSLAEALRAKDADPNVIVISFTRNFGQMSAMLAGFREARGDAIISLSADLQDPIDLVPQMIEKWINGSEVVICYRIGREDDFLSKLFSHIAYSFIRISYPQIPKGGFDYLLVEKQVMDIFKATPLKIHFFQADILWGGHRTSFIPYNRVARKFGKSQYNFTKKLNVFINSIIATSYFPIRAMSLLGIMTAFSGVIYSIIILITWVLGGTPFKGWAPLMIVNLIIGGIIMTMLGVIGEYIWRINEEVRKKPDYVIRDKYRKIRE